MKFRSNGELRTLAKQRLGGCWCECTGSLLVFIGIITAFCLAGVLVIRFLYTYGIIEYDINKVFLNGTPLFYAVTGLAAALLIVAMMPLKYGICWYYAQAAEGRNVPASCFFSCYMHPEHFRKTLKLGLSVWAHKIAVLIPTGAAAALCAAVSVKMLRSGSSILLNTVVLALMLLLATAAALFCIWYTVRYELVPYIYADCPDKSVKEIIALSGICSGEARLYLIKTMFSFIPWTACCILIFPLIYIVPYVSMAFAIAVSDIISEDGVKKAEENGKEEAHVLV